MIIINIFFVKKSYMQLIFLMVRKLYLFLFNKSDLKLQDSNSLFNYLGLGDWPTHITHIKRGKIVASHDFHNNFPELDNMMTQQLLINKQQLTNRQLYRNMGSPLLKVVEQWLREDLRELRLLQAEERKKAEQERDKVLLGEEKPKTKWDILSDNVDKYGDKYYNYWDH